MANNKKSNNWKSVNKRLTKANNDGNFYDIKGNVQKDKFSPICLSLVDSKAYRELTTTQKQLFTYMTLQTHNKQLMKKGYGEDSFYFNRVIQNNFGLRNYKQNIKNIKALEKKGFIKILEYDRLKKKKTIYSLSSDWQRKE